MVEVDESNKIKSIEEKPSIPKSNIAITGVYLFDSNVCEVARHKPSKRNELEIIDLIKYYLDGGILKLEVLGCGIAWLGYRHARKFTQGICIC